MVGQVIGAAAAPVIVQSATSDDGLINKLFKIAILLGVVGIIAVVVGLTLYILNTDLVTAVSNIITTPATLIAGVYPATAPGSSILRLIVFGTTPIVSSLFGSRSS